VEEKFDLLYAVLKDFQDAGVLKHVILIGSWCQDSFHIPATRTKDADVLIPKRLKIPQPVDVSAIFSRRGFVKHMDYDTGLAKFIHRELTFEFLTDAGAKPEEKQHRFPALNVTAQELHFMSIPLSYCMTVHYRDLALNIPEPEAFALHKLIVSQRRKYPKKKKKDIETAMGMLQFLKGKEHHIKRLHDIIDEMPKGWQKKIKSALENTGLELPD
jgi:hypothetical protein